MPSSASREPHAHRSFLSDFILGSQDGLVNILGIILGVSAATDNLKLLLVATLAALAAESISMGAVGYTSTRARRKLYLSEERREIEEMRTMPEMEREEVRQIFREWNYQGPELEEMVNRICANPQAMLELMMAFELHMSPVYANEPRNSGLLVGLATIVGSLIPLLPFLLVPVNFLGDVLASVVLSAVTLFFIGAYEARTTRGSLLQSGLQMLVIGMTAGFAGFLIGHFLGATPL